MEPKDLQNPDLAVRVDEDDGHDRRIPPRRLGAGNSDAATVHGDGLSDEYPGASVGDVHRDGYADAQGRMEPVELDMDTGQRDRRGQQSLRVAREPLHAHDIKGRMDEGDGNDWTVCAERLCARKRWRHHFYNRRHLHAARVIYSKCE